VELDDRRQAAQRRRQIPKRDILGLRVPLAPHVGNSLAGKLAGTVTTTMRSRWFMARMILRGWLQSPFGGVRYVLVVWRDIPRGRAGRRRR
jgi:hypothetical protein